MAEVIRRNNEATDAARASPDAEAAASLEPLPTFEDFVAVEEAELAAKEAEERTRWVAEMAALRESGGAEEAQVIISFEDWQAKEEEEMEKEEEKVLRLREEEGEDEDSEGDEGNETEESETTD